MSSAGRKRRPEVKLSAPTKIQVRASSSDSFAFQVRLPSTRRPPLRIRGPSARPLASMSKSTVSPIGVISVSTKPRTVSYFVTQVPSGSTKVVGRS